MPENEGGGGALHNVGGKGMFDETERESNVLNLINYC